MGRHRDSRRSVTAHDTRRRNVHLVWLFLTVVVVAAAFVLGFAVRGSATLLNAVGLSSLVEDSEVAADSSDADDTYSSLTARLSEVLTVLDEDSLDSYDLDTATKNVLEALVETTEDEYLCYYDADRYATLMQETSEEYGGIGVLFSEYDGKAYVVDVFEGSEAQAAGVQEGDFVEAIDGDDSFDWTASEVTAALTRSEGEDVVVTWRRAATLDDEGGDEFTTTLTCTDYVEANVSTKLYEDYGVGYIKLTQITSNSSSLVQEAIATLTAEGATSFVLDIRDNPGGYLTQAVNIASLFVASGTIVRIQTKTADETTKNATGTNTTDGTDLPLVVLVNENTASAAEVLAAALQDNQRATIVGTTTLGKGSVQVTRELSFGGALRYTAAYYKTPNGYDIDGVGIAPDVEVKLSGDSDNQRKLAIETAQNLAEG